MTRAADSVGANIAESYGRFNFGLKASVSLLLVRKHFETKYWLNRTRTRGLMEPEVVDGYLNQLTELARKLNAFAGGLQTVRPEQKSKPTSVREQQADYLTIYEENVIPPFFEEDHNWLEP